MKLTITIDLLNFDESTMLQEHVKRIKEQVPGHKAALTIQSGFLNKKLKGIITEITDGNQGTHQGEKETSKTARETGGQSTSTPSKSKTSSRRSSSPKRVDLSTKSVDG